MGPNSYPTGGHDRVGKREVRRLRTHNEALKAEKYARDIAAFRIEFFKKLSAYGAISETGLGWALFNGGSEEGDDVATLDRREVLLTSRYRPDMAHHERRPAPLIRLITNEPVLSDAGLSYLTEDITILENGQAIYMVDAVRTRQRIGDELEHIEGALATSGAPIFFVLQEDQLYINNNAGIITPNRVIVDDAFPDSRVIPFGSLFDNRLDDNIYALDSAQSILYSVLHTDPSHTYRHAA